GGARPLGEGGQPVDAGGGEESERSHRPGQEVSSIKVDHESPPGRASPHDWWPSQIYIGPAPVPAELQDPARYPGRALTVAFRFTRTASRCHPSDATPLGV